MNLGYEVIRNYETVIFTCLFGLFGYIIISTLALGLLQLFEFAIIFIMFRLFFNFLLQ